MSNHIAELFVSNSSELERALSAAVAAAVDKAQAHGKQGVLITRHKFSHVTVALSHQVPFGLIREYDLAERGTHSAGR